MTQYSFIKTDPAKLADLKQDYLTQVTAPLDDMWGSFVVMADHYAITCNDEIIGYCAINAEQKLLQFHVAAGQDSAGIFDLAVQDLAFTGAFVSTAEPAMLSLCLDRQKSVTVNALMYAEIGGICTDVDFPPGTDFRLITADELTAAVDFGIATLGADPDWLKGYFRERIERRELFGLWQDNGDLIATGECRSRDIDESHADVGMIVGKTHRGRGLATTILRALRHHASTKNRRAICSTEATNIPAQKAIRNAGFTSIHRILEIGF